MSVYSITLPCFGWICKYIYRQLFLLQHWPAIYLEEFRSSSIIWFTPPSPSISAQFLGAWARWGIWRWTWTSSRWAWCGNAEGAVWWKAQEFLRAQTKTQKWVSKIKRDMVHTWQITLHILYIYRYAVVSNWFKSIVHNDFMALLKSWHLKDLTQTKTILYRNLEFGRVK